MGLTELGEGKISCNDFKNILKGSGKSGLRSSIKYSMTDYDDIGGLIDMEQGRLNGPSLIQMIISVIIMITKYIAIYLISKIEYVAFGFLIYLLVIAFLKLWKWLFSASGLIGKPLCFLYNYTLDIKVPEWFPYDSGKVLYSVQPFNTILSPISNLIGCPAGADKLFDDKYGSCEARFAGEGTGCLNTYATDFTLYTENDDGTANTSAICNNIGNCKNAPEHYIIKDSVGLPIIGLPMVGLKGIGYGTSPYKYLTCCNSGQNTISTCSSSYKNKAKKAALASSSIPLEFDESLLNTSTDDDSSSDDTGPPFDEFNVYSITTSNFNEFHVYNTEYKTCENQSFFAGIENDIDSAIEYIKIIFWVLIVILIFIQINTFVKRMYYGYLLCDTYDDAYEGFGKSEFDDTLLGIMGKKDPNHDIQSLNRNDKSSVEDFEEKFPVCGHLLYCLNNDLPNGCGDNLNLQLHHKGNLISTLHKQGVEFNAKSNHSSGVDCFDKQHAVVDNHNNKVVAAKKIAVKNAKAVAASKEIPSTLLGGDVPPEAFLIIIFSFISGTIMMIINYMKKK